MKIDTDESGFSQGPSVDDPPVVIAELNYDAGLSVDSDKVAGLEDSNSRTQLIGILNRYSRRVKPRFKVSSPNRKLRMARCVNELDDITPDKRAAYVQAGFLEIESVPGYEKELLDALAQASSIWKATSAPQPVPASLDIHPSDVLTGRTPGSRNFEPAQGYLHAAPWGIDAGAAWEHDGGRGKNIKVCDIESNWLRSHEDLPAGIPMIGGQFLKDEHWRNHGTAVLGLLAAQPGQTGVHGICPEAQCLVQSGYYRSGFNTSRALASATDELEAGDIVLIEMQARGPTRRYIPMQWWDDVYSAVLTAVEKGILVVAASGNGGVDFETAAFADSNVQKDSGALLVGAGIPPTNIYDVGHAYDLIGTPRSAMPFSNYGNEVRIHAWGWHVTSLGYGDAQGGGKQRWATLRFSGTSSAAAIVAGAAACLQGIAKSRFQQVMRPDRLRHLLVDSGTPQTGDAHIGPQPDLRKAIQKLIVEGPD